MTLPHLVPPMTSPRARWVSLGALSLAAAIVWIAASDFAIAMPAISKEFATSTTTLQWANTIFTLACGALVAAGGRLGDLAGRRKLLMAGLVVLAAGSVLAALAPGPELLIAGRAVMGIGAAFILPATLAIIPAEFSGHEQVTAFSVWMAVAGAGQALGPVFGGGLTQALGWPWIFWMNLPLCLAAAFLLRFSTQESRDESAPRGLDFIGLATLSGGLVALLYALNEGPTRGWGSAAVVAALIAAVVLLVACVLAERVVRNPLVDLRLFRRHSFDGALIDNFVYNVTLGGTMYVLALYFQNVQGYDPFTAGLLLLPSTFALLALIPIGGRLSLHRGPRLPLALGTALMGAGTLMLGFLDAGTVYWWIGLGLAVQGAGIGLFSTPLSDVAVGLAPLDQAGAASGLFKTSSMIGGSFGVAVFAALYRAFGFPRFEEDVAGAGLTEKQMSIVQDGLAGSKSVEQVLKELPEDAADKVLAAARDAFAFGVGNSLKVAALASLVAVVAVLFLVPGGVLRAGAAPATPPDGELLSGDVPPTATGESPV